MKIRIIRVVIFVLVAIISFYTVLWYVDFETQSSRTESVTTSRIPTPIPLTMSEKKLYKVTAYCPCVVCCGKSDGITASGIKAKAYVTVSAGKGLPFGTQVYIEGLGIRTVQDRSINNGQIEIFFESHDEALKFGVQWLFVEIITR